MKNSWWAWLVSWWTGKKEESVMPTAASVCNDYGDGGSDAVTARTGSYGTEEPVDKWLNLEFLKLALQIEESKNARRVHYVDIGNLPKAKAEEYVKDVMKNYSEPGRADLFLARRGDAGGTEVVTLPPGGATLEAVLETAAKLKEFASE